jgi:hypothetical protein
MAHGSLKRKDNSSQGLCHFFQVSLRYRFCFYLIRSPHLTRRLHWQGDINPFLFSGIQTLLNYVIFGRSAFQLAKPAYPCPIAVHMEPFSTSAFKVLI